MLRLIYWIVIAITLLVGCNASERQPDDSSVPLVSWPEFDHNDIHWFESGDLYGLRDGDGNEILKPTYSDSRPFSNGLAAVNVGALWMFPGILDGGEWGYVNRSGELVIDIQFEYAYDFSEELAQVSISGSDVTFIDRKGNVQIEIANATAGNFQEGVAPVQRYHSSNELGPQTEYIDSTGSVIFKVNGYGKEFYDGFAQVVVRKRASRIHGYINKSGKIVIEPRFGDASQFSNGLAAVRTKRMNKYGKDGSWGYIGTDGEYVIDPIYNEARPFRDGKALVHEGGEMPEVYDMPSYWEGGTWWVIDQTGKRIGRIKD